MLFSRDSIKNLLEFLEQKYPNALENQSEIVAPHVNPAEVMTLLHYYTEEGLVEARSSASADGDSFLRIKITSKGINYLLDLRSSKKK